MAILKRSQGSVAGLDADLAELRTELSNKLETSTIVDDVTTGGADNPLSARQGVVLKGMIDSIDTLLSSDDKSLDELQEIVDYIKSNRSSIQNLSIADIDGLQSSLDAKVGKSDIIDCGTLADQLAT